MIIKEERNFFIRNRREETLLGSCSAENKNSDGSSHQMVLVSSVGHKVRKEEEQESLRE